MNNKEEFDFGKEKILANLEAKALQITMEERISDRLCAFAEKYKVRKTIAEGLDIPKDQSDRERKALIIYKEGVHTALPLYGVLSERWCFCGCGAGGRSLHVFNSQDKKVLKDVVKQVREGWKSFKFDWHWVKHEGDYKWVTDEHNLFEIQTYRQGTQREGSWPTGAEVSKIKVEYDTARRLINILTER